MIRNILRIYFCNIALRLFPEICIISFLAILIPLIGINTDCSGLIKSQSHASDSGKQIYEAIFPQYFVFRDISS